MEAVEQPYLGTDPIQTVTNCLRMIQHQFIHNNPQIQGLRMSRSATMHLKHIMPPGTAVATIIKGDSPEEISCLKNIAEERLYEHQSTAQAFDKYLRDQLDLLQQAFYAYVAQHITVHCDVLCPFKHIHSPSLLSHFGTDKVLSPHSLYEVLIKPVYVEAFGKPEPLTEQNVMDILCYRINKRRCRITNQKMSGYSTPFPLDARLRKLAQPHSLCRTIIDYVLLSTQAQQRIAVRCITNTQDPHQQNILEFLRCHWLITQWRLQHRLQITLLPDDINYYVQLTRIPPPLDQQHASVSGPTLNPQATLVNHTILKLASLPVMHPSERQSYYHVNFHTSGLSHSEQREVYKLFGSTAMVTPYDAHLGERLYAITKKEHLEPSTNKPNPVPKEHKCYVQFHPLRIDLLCQTVLRFVRRMDQLQLLRRSLQSQGVYHDVLPISMLFSVLRTRMSCSKQFGYIPHIPHISLLNYSTLGRKFTPQPTSDGENEKPYDLKNLTLDPIIHSTIETSCFIPCLKREQFLLCLGPNNAFDLDPMLVQALNDHPDHPIFTTQVDPSQIMLYQQHRANPQDKNLKLLMSLERAKYITFEKCLDDILLFQLNVQRASKPFHAIHPPTAYLSFNPLFPHIRYSCISHNCTGVRLNCTRILTNIAAIVQPPGGNILSQLVLSAKFSQLEKTLHPSEDLLDFAHVDASAPPNGIRRTLLSVRDRITGKVHPKMNNGQDFDDLLDNTPLNDGNVRREELSGYMDSETSYKAMGYLHQCATLDETSNAISLNLPFGVGTQEQLPSQPPCSGNQDCDAMRQLARSNGIVTEEHLKFVCPACVSWYTVNSLISKQGVILALYMDNRFSVIHAARDASINAQEYSKNTSFEDVRHYFDRQVSKEAKGLQDDLHSIQLASSSSTSSGSSVVSASCSTLPHQFSGAHRDIDSQSTTGSVLSYSSQSQFHGYDQSPQGHTRHLDSNGNNSSPSQHSMGGTNSHMSPHDLTRKRSTDLISSNGQSPQANRNGTLQDRFRTDVVTDSIHQVNDRLRDLSIQQGRNQFLDSGFPVVNFPNNISTNSTTPLINPAVLAQHHAAFISFYPDHVKSLQYLLHQLQTSLGNNHIFPYVLDQLCQSVNQCRQWFTLPAVSPIIAIAMASPQAFGPVVPNALMTIYDELYATLYQMIHTHQVGGDQQLLTTSLHNTINNLNTIVAQLSISLKNAAQASLQGYISTPSTPTLLTTAHTNSAIAYPAGQNVSITQVSPPTHGVVDPYRRQVLIARFGQIPCFWADWGEIIYKAKAQRGMCLFAISLENIDNMDGYVLRQRHNGHK